MSEHVGFVVLAKRPHAQRPDGFDYSTAGLIWPTLEPVKNHHAWCVDAASAAGETGVEYLIATVQLFGGGGAK
jgi:hypothetical protein